MGSRFSPCIPGGPTPRAHAMPSPVSPGDAARFCATPSRAPTRSSGCGHARGRAASGSFGTTAAPGRPTAFPQRASPRPSARSCGRSGPAQPLRRPPNPRRARGRRGRPPVRIAIVGGGRLGSGRGRRAPPRRARDHALRRGLDPGGHTNTSASTLRGREPRRRHRLHRLQRPQLPELRAPAGRAGRRSQPADMSCRSPTGAAGSSGRARRRGLFARPRHLARPALPPHAVATCPLQPRGARAPRRQRRRPVAAATSWPTAGTRDYFVDRLIVPQVSAVWSADPARCGASRRASSPSSSTNHGVLQFRNRPRLADDLRRLADATSSALIAPFADRIRLRAPGAPVQRDPDRRRRVATDAAAPSASTRWCSPATPTRRWPCSPTRRRAERELLGAIPLPAQRGRPAHRRAACCPRRRRAWACWNFHLLDEPAGRDDDHLPHEPPPVAESRARALRHAEPHRADRPGAVIRSIDYGHPVFTRAGVAAQGRWGEISGRRRTHYCGAYWRWGFHEDGVWSALRRVRFARPRPPRRPVAIAA